MRRGASREQRFHSARRAQHERAVCADREQRALDDRPGVLGHEHAGDDRGPARIAVCAGEGQCAGAGLADAIVPAALADAARERHVARGGVDRAVAADERDRQVDGLRMAAVVGDVATEVHDTSADEGAAHIRAGREDAAGAGREDDRAAVAVQGGARAAFVIEDDLARAACGLDDEGCRAGGGGHGGGSEGDVAGLGRIADRHRAVGNRVDLCQFGVAEVDARDRRSAFQDRGKLCQRWIARQPGADLRRGPRADLLEDRGRHLIGAVHVEDNRRAGAELPVQVILDRFSAFTRFTHPRLRLIDVEAGPAVIGHQSPNEVRPG